MSDDLFEKSLYAGSLVADNLNEGHIDDWPDGFHPDFKEALEIRFRSMDDDSRESDAERLDLLFEKHRDIHPNPQSVIHGVDREFK